MALPNAEKVFSGFQQVKALVVGDVMLDSYLWGEVHRISPEAPVPVVNVKKRERRLGGAANVALNLKALGAKPLLCAVVGQDEEGKALTQLMAEEKLTTEGLLGSARRITTVKHRILAGHQHLLRLDAEITDSLEPQDQEALLAKILAVLPDCQVLIFEDYDKGVLGEALIQALIREARALQIPTVVDPKKRNFWAYQGATLFKPNLKELREGLKMEIDAQSLEGLHQASSALKQSLALEQVLVTLSEWGVYLDGPEEPFHIPAHVRSIADVSGAGDTVVSVAGLCLALGLAPYQMAALANLAGGLVCEHLGVVSIDRGRLFQEAIANKIFI
ncbi:MAG: D-glycero-beta-D-manno-heptose-7-phosphate kinase [Microscillaceae bacterium]